MALFMAFTQLGIATSIVTSAFILILGGLSHWYLVLAEKNLPVSI
ncbi:hypothetical protein [Lentibacillus halodurans]|nr:hypothetical protein [Lentibacillus halodurans]